MQVMIASDIFGRTASLDRLVKSLDESLSLHGTVQFVIADPYCGEYLEFSSEENAYEHFMAHCGLDRYARRLEQTLSSTMSDPLVAIGFSVGASALWRISQARKSGVEQTFIGFYGSQIRKFPDISPEIPIELVFPEREASFSVDKLWAKLLDKQRLTLHRWAYMHGFMNADSPNFNEVGYAAGINFLSQKIRQAQEDAFVGNEN